jgi:1-acyl-sn-glycerol-3-phosphate acyltransferase
MSLVIGGHVPRRGNALTRGLGRLLLWLMGWRVEGAVPDLPKMVLIGAPHTTNMDGVIGLATLTGYGLQAGTMIKDSAFKGATGVLLRWFGAIPIDRRSAKGVVEQSVDAFNNNEKLLLLIAPEGTRHSSPEWKRGFHHIASGANVPVLPAACDYQRKVITFGPAVMPSGDYEADLNRILDFIAKNGFPQHPERLSKPLCERMGRAWIPREDQD